jgi:probable rRNA maturation factor
MKIHISGPPAGLRGSQLDVALLRARAGRSLRQLDLAQAELSISLIDDPQIAKLNSEWRSRNGPTDVLSFSLLEGEHASHRGALLGDVVISIETAAAQAAERHRSIDEEVAKLLIHGILHLAGYDHERGADEERVMRGMQTTLWKACRS